MHPQLRHDLEVNFKANQDFKLSIVSIIQSKKIKERTNKKVVPKRDKSLKDHFQLHWECCTF